jgi:hypothetical protein
MSKYTVQINRCAPWAKDPMFSSAGHDATIQCRDVMDKTGAVAFIKTHAPEVNLFDTTAYTHYADGLHFIQAKDTRGYHTTVTINEFS